MSVEEIWEMGIRMNHQQRNTLIGLVNKTSFTSYNKEKWCLTALKRLLVEYLKEE